MWGGSERSVAKDPEIFQVPELVSDRLKLFYSVLPPLLTLRSASIFLSHRRVEVERPDVVVMEWH